MSKDVTKDVTKEISERQRIILDMIGQNDAVTIPEMSQKIGVATRTIKRDIESLNEDVISTVLWAYTPT